MSFWHTKGNQNTFSFGYEHTILNGIFLIFNSGKFNQFLILASKMAIGRNNGGHILPLQNQNFLEFCDLRNF